MGKIITALLQVFPKLFSGEEFSNATTWATYKLKISFHFTFERNQVATRVHEKKSITLSFSCDPHSSALIKQPNNPMLIGKPVTPNSVQTHRNTHPTQNPPAARQITSQINLPSPSFHHTYARMHTYRAEPNAPKLAAERQAHPHASHLHHCNATRYWLHTLEDRSERCKPFIDSPTTSQLPEINLRDDALDIPE